MFGKKKSSNLHIFLISWKKSWNLKCKFKHGFPQFYVKKQYFFISSKKGILRPEILVKRAGSVVTKSYSHYTFQSAVF